MLTEAIRFTFISKKCVKLMLDVPGGSVNVDDWMALIVRVWQFTSERSRAGIAYNYRLYARKRIIEKETNKNCF